jgi:hypothetical protein
MLLFGMMLVDALFLRRMLVGEVRLSFCFMAGVSGTPETWYGVMLGLRRLGENLERKMEVMEGLLLVCGLPTFGITGGTLVFITSSRLAWFI